MSTVVRMRSVTLALLCTAAWLGTAATADARWTPRSQLVVDHQGQRGELVSQDWTERSGPDTCVSGGTYGTGEYDYPEPLQVAPGPHQAHLVFATPQRPEEVRITAHRSTLEGEHGTKLDYKLRPRRDADGHVKVWRASFEIIPPPNYYLRLYARWPSDPLCGGPRQLVRTYSVGTAVP